MALYNVTRYSWQVWSGSDSGPKKRCVDVAGKQTRKTCWLRPKGESSRTAARLVRPPPSSAALAGAARRTRRRLSGMAFRNHAATDHRQGGRAVLRKIPGALA